MKKAAEIRRPIAKKRRLFRSDVQGSSRNKENSNRSTLSIKRPRRPVSRVLFGKGAPRPPSTSPVTNARFGSIGEGDGAKQVNDLHRGQCQKESSGDGGEGSLAEWIEGGKGNSTNEDNLDEDEEAVTEDLESSEGGATQQGSVATDGKFAATKVMRILILLTNSILQMWLWTKMLISMWIPFRIRMLTIIQKMSLIRMGHHPTYRPKLYRILMQRMELTTYIMMRTVWILWTAQTGCDP
jgi:hypothetical protein